MSTESAPDLTDKSLTVDDIAAIFAVKPYTVRVWLKSEKLQGFKIPGGHWRVKESTMKKFAQDLYGEK